MCNFFKAVLKGIHFYDPPPPCLHVSRSRSESKDQVTVA